MARKKRRKDHHQQVLDGIEHYFKCTKEVQEPLIVQLHTKSVRYMPKELKGVPDLIVSTPVHTTYCEIKPRYKDSRRDTLRREQAFFIAKHAHMVGDNLRIWVIEDSAEFEFLWMHNFPFHLDDYHRRTIFKYYDEEELQRPWLPR